MTAEDADVPANIRADPRLLALWHAARRLARARVRLDQARALCGILDAAGRDRGAVDPHTGRARFTPTSATPRPAFQPPAAPPDLPG